MGSPIDATHAAEVPPKRSGSPRARPAVRVLRVLVTAMVVAGAIWMLRGVRFDVLFATFREASWPVVLGAMALNITLNTTARAMRWRALLPPSAAVARRAPFGAFAAIVLISQLANNVLPLRLGEAMRTLALTDRYGYPVRAVVASQLVEKVIEVTSMAGFAVPALVSEKRASELAVAGAVLFAGFFGLFALVRLARAPRTAGEGEGAGPAPSRGTRLVHMVQDAARTVDAPRTWWRAMWWAVLSDVIDVALIGACCAALGVRISVASMCAILVAVNVAISVPSTPANVGMLEAGALVVLLGLGVPREKALAAALVYHAVHAVPTSVGGAISLFVTGVRRPRGHAT